MITRSKEILRHVYMNSSSWKLESYKSPLFLSACFVCEDLRYLTIELKKWTLVFCLDKAGPFEHEHGVGV